MADEVLPVTDAAPATEPVVEAAVVEAPAAVEATVEPVVEPVAEPAAEPVVEEPVVEEPVVEPEPAVEPAVEPATEPVVEAAAAPEPIAYVDFEIPEGLVVEPTQIESFHGVLNKYGLSQEAGQELMNLHAETLRNAVTATDQRNADRFEEMRRGWRGEIDKQYGNKRDTTINDAKWAITELVKDKKQQEAVWNAFGVTGAGDHPAVVGLMASVAKRLRERNAPTPVLPTRASENKADARYGAQR